jgi:speckle-type POZ protein
VAEGGHAFLVHNYTLLKSLGVGMPVRSGAFDVGGHSWAILFYPAGSDASADGQHHVSVYLELLTPDAVVPAWFDLALMDQSSGQWHSILGGGGGLHAVFDSTNWFWGEPSCRGSDLETPQYVRNGSLAIRCDVRVVTPRLWEARPVAPMITQPVTPMITQAPPPMITQAPAPPSPPGLPEDLGRLLEDKHGCDVTVRVRGEAFPAHGAILAARSPLLRKKLLDADKAKTKTKTRPPPPPSVEITLDNDMEPAVFKALLHFIYTDNLEVPPPPVAGDDGGEGMAEFLRRMFVAADGCGVEALKWHCESLLCGILSNRTLSATMAFADRHRCGRLRAACAAAAGPRRGREGMGDSEACKRLKKN